MTYTAIRPRSATRLLTRSVMGVLVRPKTAARDTRGRPRAQILDDSVRDAFGAAPDLDARKDLLYLLMYGGIIGAFCVGAVGLGLGALVQAIAGQGIGSAVMKTFGVLGAAPLLSLGIVWAARAQFNDIDYRKWSRAGRPEGHVPSGVSQPKDRDLLYALPLALYVAAIFWGA